MSTQTRGHFDVETLRRGIEEGDADAQLSLYADDAVVRMVDRTNPPSSPRELHGREAIGEYVRDVCGRDMTHRVEQVVVGDDRAAFTEACEYADGTRVLCATVLELRDGQIVNQVAVSAWDE